MVSTRCVAALLVVVVVGCKNPPASRQGGGLGRGRAARVTAIIAQGNARIMAWHFSTGARDLAAITRLAPDGSIDPTFGIEGLRLLELDGSPFPDVPQNRPIRLVSLRDGRLLVAGTTKGLAIGGSANAVVMRLTRDGAIDTSFGRAGQAIIDLGGNNELRGLAVQADGRVLVAIASWADAGRASSLVLARLSADGRVDPSFGTDGALRLEAELTEVHDLLLQTLDGRERAIIGGEGGGDRAGLTVRRVLLDAPALDPSFGSGGVAVLQVGPQFTFASMVLQASGALVVLGNLDGWRPALARVTVGGALDATFQGGVVSGPTVAVNSAWGSLTQTADGFLIGAASGGSQAFHGWALAVWTADGEAATGETPVGSTSTGFIMVDPVEGTDQTTVTTAFIDERGAAFFGGSARLNYLERAVLVRADRSSATASWVVAAPRGTGDAVARAAAIGADGKATLVGSALNSLSRDLLVTRVNADGSTDESFGDHGAVLIDGASFDDDGFDVALTAEGAVLAAGCLARRPTILRLDAHGALDTTFGTQGFTTLPSTGLSACARRIMLRPDGRIAVIGFDGQEAFPPFRPAAAMPLVATLSADGVPDDGFALAAAQPLVSRLVNRTVAGALLPDGTIVAAGSSNSPSGAAAFAFAPTGAPTWHFSVEPASGFFASATTTQAGVVLAGGTDVAGSGQVELAQLRADGTPDPTFGTQGHASVDLGDGQVASAVTTDARGRLLVALKGAGFSVSRFDAAGAVDPTFGAEGVSTLTTPRPSHAEGVAVANDQVWVVGGATDADGVEQIAVWPFKAQ